MLAADFLQSLVNKASDQGALNLPVTCSSDSSFPIVQCADDTLIIMEGCERQLSTLKDILDTFTLATGLQVNYSKSLMVPFNMSQEKLHLLATSFNCAKGVLLFTYLGLPLGITKQNVADFLPLVSKCGRRLQVTSAFLSQAGRLQMINAIFTVIPIFQMSTYLLPKTIIKQIDNKQRHNNPSG